MNIDVMEDVLRTIADADHRTIVAWAEFHHVDSNILRTLKIGYQPRWQQAAEYRGALVHVYREMARFALEHMNK